MSTVSKVLSIAMKEVGVKENPPNSNRVKYNTWYYGKPVVGAAYPWCMVFCQWVYKKAGVELPVRTASCGEMMRAAKEDRAFHDRDYQPGDLVLYNFKGGRAPTHCGIIRSVTSDYIEAVEGNTSISSNDNGGSVMIRKRPIVVIVGAVRPRFREELEMTIDEFLKSCTDEQAYTLLKKAMRYADTLPEPDWSKKEGAWAALLESGVINTNTPEGILKRDEMAAILDRFRYTIK